MTNIKLSKSTVWIAIATTAVFLICVNQAFGYSPDYLQYESFFYDVKNYFEYAYSSNRFEPGFFFTSFALGRIFDSEVVMYGVIAAISISIKLFYVFKFSSREAYFWIIIFYAFKYFPLHELTQLRASLAAAFLIGSFYYISIESKRTAIIFGVVAATFHYSAIMILPFMFFPSIDLKKILFLALSIFLVLYLGSDFLVDLAGMSFSVFELYEKSGYSERELNIFSPVFFPELFMISISFLLWAKLSDVMRKVVMIEVMGFALFYAFSGYGVIAVRGRELFSIFWIIFIAQIPLKLNNLKIAIQIFVFSSIALSLYLYYLSDFFVPVSRIVG